MSAQTRRGDVRKLVTLALLIAIGVVLSQLKTFPLFSNFLQYDASGAIIVLAALLYGPAEGTLVALLVGVLRLPLIEAGSYFGIAMDVAAYLALAVPAGLLARRLHGRRAGYAVALGAGALCMTAAMIALNITLTPVFWGIARPAVMKMIVPALLPFNVVKAVVNSALAFGLYEALKKALRSETSPSPSPAISGETASGQQPLPPRQ